MWLLQKLLIKHLGTIETAQDVIARVRFEFTRFKLKSTIVKENANVTNTRSKRLCTFGVHMSLLAPCNSADEMRRCMR